MPKIIFKCPTELVERIDKRAQELCISRSEFLRRVALERVVKEQLKRACEPGTDWIPVGRVIEILNSEIWT